MVENNILEVVESVKLSICIDNFQREVLVDEDNICALINMCININIGILYAKKSKKNGQKCGF